MSVQHAIIAGVNKCGTTSVFRYLADHPDVCASSIKETRFFNDVERATNAKSYDEYLGYFTHRESNQTCLLEASPDYFSSGTAVASEIKSVLPNVKIIVLLRDPVKRLISYYRSALVYDNYANTLLAGLSFADFVDVALSAQTSDGISDPQATECRRALHQGCYAQDHQEFGTVFSPNQCAYFFFEDLASNPRLFMQEITQFLGLDARFFGEYEFRIENKTRVYRSPLLQKIGFNINTKLEPFFNKFPRFRRLSQDVYRLLNESPESGQVQIDQQSCARLEEFYRLDRDRLRAAFADGYSATRLPGWLGQ